MSPLRLFSRFFSCAPPLHTKSLLQCPGVFPPGSPLGLSETMWSFLPDPGPVFLAAAELVILQKIFFWTSPGFHLFLVASVLSNFFTAWRKTSPLHFFYYDVSYDCVFYPSSAVSCFILGEAWFGPPCLPFCVLWPRFFSPDGVSCLCTFVPSGSITRCLYFDSFSSFFFLRRCEELILSRRRPSSLRDQAHIPPIGMSVQPPVRPAPGPMLFNGIRPFHDPDRLTARTTGPPPLSQSNPLFYAQVAADFATLFRVPYPVSYPLDFPTSYVFFFLLLPLPGHTEEGRHTACLQLTSLFGSTPPLPPSHASSCLDPTETFLF